MIGKFASSLCIAVMAAGPAAAVNGISVDGRVWRSSHESLYERGAEVMQMWGPGDKASRIISLKMHTSKVPGNASDEVFETIAACDITYPASTLCKSFAFRGTGALDTVFQFDDRPGYKKYVLRTSFTVDGDVLVTLGRPGNEEQLSTSVRRMLGMRARQASSEGMRVWINGSEFLILGQGDPAQGFLFFPGDLGDRLNSMDKYAMAPVLMAEGQIEAPMGGPSVREGRASLGWIGSRSYGLVYDSGQRAWMLEECYIRMQQRGL
ncbi:MAG: hypothetical protein WC943_16585 [Elusimicrobiota bacterium]|jgi:hypothetical protein